MTRYEILAGQLYMGPWPKPGAHPDMNAIVGLALERPVYPIDHPQADVLYTPFRDEGPPHSHEITIARTAAIWACERLFGSNRVLITCLAGQNRSGLVTGFVLRRLGFTGRQALELIRSQRGAIALNNEWFETLVLRG